MSKDIKYGIIYADPPWSYNDKGLNRGGALRHYNTMSIDEIKKMPVIDIADKDCALFIWVTFPKLQEGLDVIKSWGFEFKTCAFVWIKTNKRTHVYQASFLPIDSFDSFMGMGRWTRSNAETCLLATKGNPKRIHAGIHQIIYSPLEKHSKKPNIVRDKIDLLMGNNCPRVELFARESYPGWDVFGNEVENSILL